MQGPQGATNYKLQKYVYKTVRKTVCKRTTKTGKANISRTVSAWIFDHGELEEIVCRRLSLTLRSIPECNSQNREYFISGTNDSQYGYSNGKLSVTVAISLDGTFLELFVVANPRFAVVMVLMSMMSVIVLTR